MLEGLVQHKLVVLDHVESALVNYDLSIDLFAVGRWILKSIPH